jgi:cell division protein FtsQ
VPGRLNWWETVLFSVLFLIAAFILVCSPLFEIDKVTVEGNHLLTETEVRAASGIVPGSNIFRVQLGEAQARLEALPLVRRAQLERRFPAEVVIIVEERQPVALLSIAGEFWEVDVEGVPVRPKAPGWSDLPVITGVRFDDPDLNHVLETVVKLPAPVVMELSEIHYTPDRRFMLYTFEGIEVRLGQAERLDRKCALLLEILSVVRQEGRMVAYIDLSEPEKAVVKYTGTGGGGNGEV